MGPSPIPLSQVPLVLHPVAPAQVAVCVSFCLCASVSVLIVFNVSYFQSLSIEQNHSELHVSTLF